MKALKIVGMYRDTSGYANLVRAFVRELCQMGVQIQLIPMHYWTSGKLPPRSRDPIFDRLSNPVDANTALHFGVPCQVRIDPRRRNINFTMFESTRIPKLWLTFNQWHDQVIVPTESSRQAWLNGGYADERLRLCPLGVDPDAYKPGVAPLDIGHMVPSDMQHRHARFLNISDLSPRKNVVGLVRCWLKATQSTDDAVLILKLNGDRLWLQTFMSEITALECSIGRKRKMAAPIIFITNTKFSDSEMPSLFAMATHYLSMSCGEGWDLPMMQAGAMGLGLIAPRHSAYTAYLDDRIANLIPAHAVPAVFTRNDNLEQFFVGSEWWEPDEDATCDAIINAIKHPDTHRGALASSRIREDFSWRRAAIRLIEVLDETEYQPSISRKFLVNQTWHSASYFLRSKSVWMIRTARAYLQAP